MIKVFVSVATEAMCSFYQRVDNKLKCVLTEELIASDDQ
jgi:hypothetical protein